MPGKYRWYLPKGLWIPLALGVAGCLVWIVLFRSPPQVLPPSPTGPTPSASPTAPAPERAATIRFVDVTSTAGIDFTHVNGAKGDKWYPETIGAGVGFLDYNNDAWPDILLVNGTHWPSNRPDADVRKPPTMHLYRNRGDGTFENVTHSAGLDVPLYGMGLASADYDNDGDTDLLVTGYLRNLFFINNGDGSFTEATQRVGIHDGKWGSGAAVPDPEYRQQELARRMAKLLLNRRWLWRKRFRQ